MITNKPKVLDLVKHYQPEKMIPNIINISTAKAGEVSNLFNHHIDLMLQMDEVTESNISYLQGVYDCVSMALSEGQVPYVVVVITKEGDLTSNELDIINTLGIPINFLYGNSVVEAVATTPNYVPAIVELPDCLVNFSAGLQDLFSNSLLSEQALEDCRNSFVESLNRKDNDYNAALVNYKNLVDELRGELTQALANANEAGGMYQTEVGIRTQLEAEINSLKAQIEKLTAQLNSVPQQQAQANSPMPQQEQPQQQQPQPVNSMAQQLNQAGQTTESYTMAQPTPQPVPQPMPQPTPQPAPQVVPDLPNVNLIPFNIVPLPAKNMNIRDRLPMDIMTVAPTLYVDATPPKCTTKFIQCITSQEFYFYDEANACWIHYVAQ